jgi:prolyl oligopeptidase PreP (S9A serine peptidase family)
VELIFRPTPKQALQGVGITKNNVLVNISDNVAVKVMAYTKSGWGWILEGRAAAAERIGRRDLREPGRRPPSSATKAISRRIHALHV